MGTGTLDTTDCQDNVLGMGAGLHVCRSVYLLQVPPLIWRRIISSIYMLVRLRIDSCFLLPLILLAARLTDTPVRVYAEISS